MSRKDRRRVTVVLAEEDMPIKGMPFDESKVKNPFAPFDPSKFNGHDFKIENAIEKDIIMVNVSAKVMNEESKLDLNKEIVMKEIESARAEAKEKFNEAMGKFKEGATKAVEKVKGFFSSIWAKIKAAWNRLVEFCKDKPVAATVTGVVAVCGGIAAAIFIPVPVVASVFIGLGIASVTFLVSSAVQIVIEDRKDKQLS